MLSAAHANSKFQDIQTTERELQNIGLRARDIVVAVAKSCSGAGQNLNDQLQNDLNQLTE